MLAMVTIIVNIIVLIITVIIALQALVMDAEVAFVAGLLSCVYIMNIVTIYKLRKRKKPVERKTVEELKELAAKDGE